MTLSSAYLCVNCENVGEQSSACEVCGSRALIHLGKVLNQTPITYMDEVVRQLVEAK